MTESRLVHENLAEFKISARFPDGKLCCCCFCECCIPTGRLERLSVDPEGEVRFERTSLVINPPKPPAGDWDPGVPKWPVFWPPGPDCC